MASVSRHSSSGTESATTPADACTCSSPSLTMPELEWKETEAKARALLRAAELVEEGF